MNILFQRIWVQLVIIAVAGIPTWIWLLLRALLNPHGFWENFILLGAGVWVMGIVQFFLLIAGAFISWVLWMESGSGPLKSKTWL